ncbi:CG4733 [Drosophila busckii]|uniref:CG4733 n=2 Tax=Drosophila busckii TaxID=30019 RepID=A0A0M4EJW7_DROBS|nr:CG4733 [Drosophila busckii]
MLFEKRPDVRNSFLDIKRPVDPPPKSLLKVKLHATPPPPPTQEQNLLQKEIRSSKSVYIPRFYFPHGKPQPTIAMERVIRGILSAFDSFPNNQVTKDELPRILKLCGLPFYWRMPVMIFCQAGSTGLVERQRFVEFWKQMNVYCHEAASRFVYILSRGQRFRSYIMPEDLVPMVQDVVDTHPGLAFLKEATEFHSRYVHTVIARIFYSVNRSWSGKITISELKRSDLLEMISLLEEEEDINQIMAFFSYEHFYVIYCKFWELDKDHDLLINQDDLAKHSDNALSTRIVERIFSGCVTRNDNKKAPEDEPKMSYTDFVWFILSEEDKRTPTAIEYWFRCMDIDGDGALSMYELEYFYEEQQQRMEGIGIECLPFEDCLCQMLDMIKPVNRDSITLGDLKRCKMTHVFFDTFFNLEKYLDHEQRDPFASQRDETNSDWDRFAAQEYELLISEENE